MEASGVTCWFLSSVSSVEVSVLGLASAILDSPQFFGWPLRTETKFDCSSFGSDSNWDPTIAANRLKSEVASV